MKLSSSKKAEIIDNEFISYKLENLNIHHQKKLKGLNIKITTNSNLSKNKDIYQFKDGIFNLENKKFLAVILKSKLKDTLKIREMIRIYGVSSEKVNNTTLNKAIFTSCGLNDKCPPWSIKADKITHDKDKNNLR